MKFYDDDMDELFNKAGRDYPLKTEPKNWEAVRGALLQENGAAGVTQKRNGWRRLLPLLFLLLIPAVYLFIDKDNINSTTNSAINKTEPAVTNTNTEREREVNRITTSTERERLVHKKVPLTEGETGTERASEKQVDQAKDEVITIPLAPERKSETATQTHLNQNNVSENRFSEKNLTENKLRENKLGDELTMWNNIPTLNTEFISRNEPSEEISLNTPVKSLNQSTTGQTSVPNFDKKTKNRKGPYLGVIAAPDVSTIKGQQVKGIGYSAGAIVGYTINNHWQVEAGVLWSHKKYYTDGKYFDKTGPGIPASVKMLWLNGGCEMLEFPVLARYNFSEKRNTFFASAGLTSYMMKKEDYDYKAVVDPGNYTYEGYREYDRSGDHLFANLQLSAGYNFTLSSKLNIRIEPYLKTPLKKIGIGKMPITSTGLYFAITRDFR